MGRENREVEINAALSKLEQAEATRRQHAVALCAEKPEQFGPKFFCEIITRGWDATSRWYAIRALGGLRAKQCSQVLLDVLRQPDISIGGSSLHRICARSIGLLGCEMVSDVAGLLENSDEATRVAAVDALGEIGHPSAIPALSECLLCGQRNVQLWAALSLAKIGSQSVPVLVRALARCDKEEALIVLDALTRINDPGVIDAIADALATYPNVVSFYFSRSTSAHVPQFLKMVQEVASSTRPENAKARKILLCLRLNTRPNR